jgi:amylosucrase
MVMAIDPLLEKQSIRSLARLKPRLEESCSAYASESPQEWQTFIKRLDDNFLLLFKHLIHLYGSRYDFFFHLEDLLTRLAHSWMNRPDDLKALDAQREANPLWYQSNKMLGGVCYVDLFAGNLKGLCEMIPYFKELGLTYLHLMPLFKVPEGENDGGYAVSSYREVNSMLGSMDQLSDLARMLRDEGISLVLDLVFNHTSDEHEWAQLALAGDEDYQDYYLMFPDRTLPDAYEKHLREIFPDEHPGAFTFREDIKGWVWTTFHSYQWDLNYSNPVVFNRMVDEMLFLANAGTEILRLDAVAFIWKQLGTSCENLPEAHILIQAFNAVARIASPSLLFKSEAIVHPDDVTRYISPEECQLSYNPLLMALLWNSLATREVRLLKQALAEQHRIHPQCAWVNYVRCHDDIGWTFSDEAAARFDITGSDHRRFLNSFYTGRFEGSFARGLPFQENPKTGDARISGTCASLAGLEKAIKEETQIEVDLAIQRILLIHAVILTVGGIPLLYLGDEVGTLNDYSFRTDTSKSEDSRWVHRPYTDWEKLGKRTDPETIEGRIFLGLQRLVHLRENYAIFGAGSIDVMEPDNDQILAFTRVLENERVMVFANFSESVQTISANLLRLYGLSYSYLDILTAEQLPFKDIVLEPYGLKCIWVGTSGD